MNNSAKVGTGIFITVAFTAIYAVGVTAMAFAGSSSITDLSALNVKTMSKGEYLYPESAGSGATVYVMDTGVESTMSEFDGNVVAGYDAIEDKPMPHPTDCGSHGTSVASIVSSKTYGVAKKATIVPVKVLPCGERGNIVNIFSGLEWIEKNPPKNGTVGIVNMSFSHQGKVHEFWEQEIQNKINEMTEKGFFFIGVAGNNSTKEKVANSCNEFPSNLDNVFQVGAYRIKDGKFIRASFSSSGKCIDIWAGGYNIQALTTPNTEYAYNQNGTSLASPQVAGLAALLVSENPTITVASIKESLMSNAYSGMTNSEDTPLGLNYNDSSSVTRLVAQLPF